MRSGESEHVGWPSAHAASGTASANSCESGAATATALQYAPAETQPAATRTGWTAPRSAGCRYAAPNRQSLARCAESLEQTCGEGGEGGEGGEYGEYASMATMAVWLVLGEAGDTLRTPRQ